MSVQNKVNIELEKLVTDSRISKIETVLDNRTSNLTIVLDNISNLHNISAVIRSVDAFGITDIHLINNDSNSLRDLSDGISLGSEKWVNLIQHKDESELISTLKANNMLLVALLPPDKNNQSIPITQLPFENPLALMFGNEVKGLNDKLIENADISAYIPMYGFVESLNISVACAISLFCSTIATTKPKLRPNRMTKARRLELREEWIRKSIQNVDKIEDNLLKRFS